MTDFEFGGQAPQPEATTSLGVDREGKLKKVTTLADGTQRVEDFADLTAAHEAWQRVADFAGVVSSPLTEADHEALQAAHETGGSPNVDAIADQVRYMRQGE